MYQSVQSELKEIKEELNNLKKENIELSKKNSLVYMDGGIARNGFTVFNDGNAVMRMKYPISVKGCYSYNYKFPIMFKENTEIFPIVNVINNKNIQVRIEKVDIYSITIYFEKHGFNEVEDAEVSIIAIGKYNEKHKNC